MGVYGPFNASLNKVVQVTGIDVNADRVFIDNQSKYTLAVGFTPTQPVAVLTLYGHPWYGEVPPGGKTIPIRASAYNEQFPGYFWVLALDPTSASRAYTGAISGNTAFFVQSLVKGEPSPPDYAIPQAVDAASQQRIIVMPPGPDTSISDNVAVNATGIVKSYQMNNFGGGPINANPPAGFAWFCYLQMLHMSCSAQSYNFDWELRMIDTNGMSQVNGIAIFTGVLTPSTPINLGMFICPTQGHALFANTSFIRLDLNIQTMSGAGGVIFYDWVSTTDTQTGGVVPKLGQGAEGFVVAGALY